MGCGQLPHRNLRRLKIFAQQQCTLLQLGRGDHHAVPPAQTIALLMSRARCKSAPSTACGCQASNDLTSFHARPLIRPALAYE